MRDLGLFLESRQNPLTVSKSAAAGNTWQTASTIARLNRFYGDTPIKLFDGANGHPVFQTGAKRGARR
jgi:hypothetical protein